MLKVMGRQAKDHPFTQNVEHVVPTVAEANNINKCSNICRGSRRPRRPPRLEQRSAASANCTQNHPESLKTAQNRSVAAECLRTREGAE